MSRNQHLSVEDCYARGSSPFRTVIIAAQEARFINEQANLGYIKLSEKPTTIAIHKFKNNRLEVEVPQPESDGEGLDGLGGLDLGSDAAPTA